MSSTGAAPAPVARTAAAVTGSFGATVAIQLLNTATGVLLARAFAPSARGELAAILLWPNVIGVVATLGVFEATTFTVARRTDPLGSIVGSGAALALAQGLLFTCIGAAVLPVALHRYSSHVLDVAYTYLPYIAMSVLSLMLLGVVNGLQRDRAFHVMRVLVIAVAAVVVAALAATGLLSFESAVAAYLIAQVLTLGLSAAIVLRATRDGIHVDRPLTRRLFRYGLASHSGSISAQLNQRLDLLVISVFLSTRDLGLYTVATTLTAVGYLLGISVAYVLLPRVASAADRARRVVLARRATVMTFWVSCAIALPVVALTPVFVRFFFGDRYGPASGIARILVVAGVALGASRTLEAVLRGLRRPMYAGLSEIVALVVTVLGLTFLLPSMGITGAAISSLLAYGVSMMLMALLAARALDVPVRSLFTPTRDDRLAVRDAATRAIRLIAARG